MFKIKNKKENFNQFALIKSAKIKPKNDREKHKLKIK